MEVITDSAVADDKCPLAVFDGVPALKSQFLPFVFFHLHEKSFHVSKREEPYCPALRSMFTYRSLSMKTLLRLIGRLLRRIQN